MQRSPKAMLLRPTNVDLPECDCHLPPMESDGRRSRPVAGMQTIKATWVFARAIRKRKRENRNGGDSKHSVHKSVVQAPYGDIEERTFRFAPAVSRKVRRILRLKVLDEKYTLSGVGG